MTSFKPLKQNLINSIRYSQKPDGIFLEKFARTTNAAEYSDQEITEMYIGFFKDKKFLLTDSDEMINLDKVKSAYCILEEVTYVKKPNRKDYETNKHNHISNIRTFYIKNYFLVTEDKSEYGNNHHEITRRLLKAGAFQQSGANFRWNYKIPNRDQSLQKFKQGEYPTDLFYPIKYFINEYFFEDAYKVDDFHVETPFKIER